MLLEGYVLALPLIFFVLGLGVAVFARWQAGK